MSAPAGDVISLGRPSPIEQRRERESAAIKQKLENKMATVASLLRGDDPMPTGSQLVQMKVRFDLIGVHHYIDLMTESAARRLTGNGPLTPFEQIIRLLPVLTDEERNRLKLMLDG